MPKDEKRMKRGILTSYIDGLTDRINGERYRTILRYFLPEFITALLLYAMPTWIDSFFIGQLKSTSSYAALGLISTWAHLLIKLAEGFSVGATVLVGRFNGIGAYRDVGHCVRDTFWMTILAGGILALTIFWGAPTVCSFYCVSSVVNHAIPFLRLKAISLFLTFIYMGFVGFLRGVKNTRVPMYIFGIGVMTFIVFDYLLIFGMCYFPQMGLLGSAIASIVQYAVMLMAIVIYILCNKENRRYVIQLLDPLTQPSYAQELFVMSWPVALDKVIFALSYVWLGYLISPMGKQVSAAFNAVRDVERVAFLPAIAFAQVVTFLVSNDFGVGNWKGMTANIKKILLLSLCMVSFLLIALNMWPSYLLSFLDQKRAFTDMTIRAMPLLAPFILFDLVQVILSGALRGAGDVKTVMRVRLFICFGYFIPASWLLSMIFFEDLTLKFILMYGLFYVGNALMGIMYVNRLRSDGWQQSCVGEQT